MKKIGKIRNIITALVVCFLGIIMVQVNVFAEYDTYNNYVYGSDIYSDMDNFHIVPGSITYEFLRNTNLNDLTILHSDGTAVSEEIQNEFLRKLDVKDFEGLASLIVTYQLYLLTITHDEAHPSIRNIGNTGSFELITTHFYSIPQSNYGGWSGYVELRMRGSVTFNPDGTITPNGNPIVIADGFRGDGWLFAVANPRHEVIRIENNRAVLFIGRGNLTTTFRYGALMPINLGSFHLEHRFA